MFLAAVLLFTCVFAHENEKVSYRGYQFWQLNLKHQNITDEIMDKIAQKDVWNEDKNSIDFLLNGNEIEYWNEFLTKRNVSYNILVHDLQETIDKVLMKKSDARRGMPWVYYSELKEIYAYLTKIALSNPQHCTYSSIGKTVHKKDIKMLKISNGNPRNSAILIDGGTHAREWVTVVAVLYLIESIAWNFTKQPDFVQNKDWYIIPVLNPDGYEYSRTKNHMWRKNRRRFSGQCDGVDINRNFDYRWCQKGTSSIICSEDYCGPEPFSEQESLAIKGLAEGRRFLAYVSIHSYGSKVIYPGLLRSHTSDYKLHTKVAKEMVMAMRAIKNERYVAGDLKIFNSRQVSGMAIEWFYFTQNIVHSYIIETRGKIKTDFFLDSKEVNLASLEVRAGLMRLAQMLS